MTLMTNMWIAYPVISPFHAPCAFVLFCFSCPFGFLCVVRMQFLKQGGDIFHDLVVHDADFVMHLLQERPTKVMLHMFAMVQDCYHCAYI